MDNKSEISWIKLAFGLGLLALKFVALILLAVRYVGEVIGASVASTFLKQNDTEKEQAEKVAFGEKTGGLVGSLLTLGIVGSYIIDTSGINGEGGNQTVGEAEQKASVEGASVTEPGDSILAETLPQQDVVAMDRNGDGLIDGFDTNNNGIADKVLTEANGYDTDGDGIIDTNKDRVPLPDLEYVAESGYIRTVADGDKSNNLSS